MAGVMLSVGQVAGVWGRLIWGWCADRYLGAVATLALLALLLTLGSVSLALLPAGTTMPVVALALLVLGAAGEGWNGVYLAEVARRAPPGKTRLTTADAPTCPFLGAENGRAWRRETEGRG